MTSVSRLTQSFPSILATTLLTPSRLPAPDNSGSSHQPFSVRPGPGGIGEAYVNGFPGFTQFVIRDCVFISCTRPCNLPLSSICQTSNPQGDSKDTSTTPIFIPFLRDAVPPSCYRGSCNYKAGQAVGCLTVTPCMAFALHSVHATV
jgi:hypothetical protein